MAKRLRDENARLPMLGWEQRMDGFGTKIMDVTVNQAIILFKWQGFLSTDATSSWLLLSDLLGHAG
ncbi:hypothetical protein DYQ86_15655 [Acidobacteria bacterium AB60]|nr:hypothetical protein DYQ86_15655 [Acidobacteria bacterium AB60]